MGMRLVFGVVVGLLLAAGAAMLLKPEPAHTPAVFNRPYDPLY